MLEDEIANVPFITPTGDPITLFQSTDGAGRLESVVPDGEGFLGLGSRQSDGGLPNIVRSLDGVDWRAIEVQLVAAESTESSLQSEVTYEHLIATDVGYALLMRATESQSDGDGGGEGDGARPASHIRRLVSPDGETWSIDPNFATLDLASGSIRVAAHGSDSFVTTMRPPSENRSLQELLELHFDGTASTGPMCAVELQIGGELTVYPCSEGEERTVVASDAIQPELFEALRDCAIHLSRQWVSDSSTWVVGRANDPAELTGASSLLFRPGIMPDGRLVAVDYPSSPSAGATACDGFLELETPPAPAVVVWSPEEAGNPVRHPIPAEIDVASLLSVGAEPAISGRELLTLVGTGLTSIDLTSIDVDSGIWEKVLTLPVRPDDETSVKITTDGSQLVYLDSARVTLIELATRSTRFVESEGGNRPGFPQIIYADNDVVFARGANSIFKIDVPEG